MIFDLEDPSGMGAISSEARGIVRRELERIRIPASSRIAALFDQSSTCFESGKRLTPEQADGILKDAAELIRGERVRKDRWIYPWSAPFVVKQADGSKFEELILDVRSIRLEVGRRRLCFWDRALGLGFTAHSLGRIVERAGVKENLWGYVLANLMSLLPPLGLIAGGHLLLPEMILPFGHGIVFVEPATTNDIGAVVDYRCDARGVGYLPEAEVAMGQRLTYRVATYLSADAIQGQREEIFESWSKFNQDWADIGDLAALQFVASEEAVSMHDRERAEKAVSAFAKIIKSNAWKSVLSDKVALY